MPKARGLPTLLLAAVHEGYCLTHHCWIVAPLLYFMQAITYTSQGCGEMTLYGYARVSVREPEDKNLDLQVERAGPAPAAPWAPFEPRRPAGPRTTAAASWNCGPGGQGGHPGGHPHRPPPQGADLRAAGGRGPAPRGSGVPVPVGGLRHYHRQRQAPAPDGARLQ